MFINVGIRILFQLSTVGDNLLNHHKAIYSQDSRTQGNEPLHLLALSLLGHWLHVSAKRIRFKAFHQVAWTFYVLIAVKMACLIFTPDA